MILDVVASRVHGFFTARDCRVVWSDGKLYICKSPSDITVFDCEKPEKSAGSYKVRVGDKALRFQLASCGTCRQRVQKSPVGRMSVDEIVAAATESVDA